MLAFYLANLISLYFACDIAEEYASVTKRWLSIGTISIIVIHLLLLFGGFPYMNVGIGIAAHLSYLPLLKTFPYVEPVSVALIFAVMVSAANHMNWFHFFVDQFTARDSIVDRDELTAIRVVGCIFVFVWLIPVGLTFLPVYFTVRAPGHVASGRKRYIVSIGLLISGTKIISCPSQGR